MAKGRPDAMVGLDIGTSKTAVIIAEVGSGSPKLTGWATSPSIGLQRGMITDTGAVAKSIGQALEKAEKMAGVKAASAYISYSGADINVRDCREFASRRIPGNEGYAPVVPELETAGILRGEKVIQIIPARVMPGESKCAPAAEAWAVTAGAGSIDSIVQSALLAGLAVEAVVFGPLAGAEALLSTAERELGTVLIDFGAGTTSVSIFDRGFIRKAAVLSVGGEHLEGDLAIGLRTSLANAQKILKNYLTRAYEGEKKELKLNAGQGVEGNNVDGNNNEAADLTRAIIEARVTEILDLVAATIESFNYPGPLTGGAVLHGGVSQLKGLAHFAENILKMPVRIGALEITELLEPFYTSAFGLIKYIDRCLREEKDYLNNRSKANGGIAGRFLHWFLVRLGTDPRLLKD